MILFIDWLFQGCSDLSSNSTRIKHMRNTRTDRMIIKVISMGLIREMTGMDMMMGTLTVIIISSLMMDLMGPWGTLLN